MTEQLKYNASDNNRDNNTEEKKQRKGKIFWFNPPYSINLRTKKVKTFFELMRKHFPDGNPLHEILNKNTLKVSYSYMGKWHNYVIP